MNIFLQIESLIYITTFFKEKLLLINFKAKISFFSSIFSFLQLIFLLVRPFVVFIEEDNL